jgi:colicin import membrane protein
MKETLVSFILIHYLMSNFNFADCRKAVNQATFRPTADRKAAATKLLQEALDFIANLEEVKETSKKSKKRRRKTTKKATPSQKVADRQEKAFHGKADTPVKPSKKAKTASVKEAAASAKAVSEATGAAQRAAKKAELKAEALKKEAKASETKPKASKKAVQPKVEVTESAALKELREQLTALTECVALMMQAPLATSANEVSLEEAGVK